MENGTLDGLEGASIQIPFIGFFVAAQIIELFL